MLGSVTQCNAAHTNFCKLGGFQCLHISVGEPPSYCQRFPSVKCNQLNQVASISIAGVANSESDKVPLDRVLRVAANFTALQVW